jgi:nanoRNase/pAp phosphatase (c-di-AMP/oligoRNAs hydrolase)
MADPFGCDHEPHRRLIQIGPILVAKKAEAVTRALERAWRTTTAKGTRLVVFEGTSLTSDAAEALGDTADLVIGFGYEVEDGQAKLILSSRSHTTFDCSALAKRFGGGGHTAAGFSTTFGFAYTGGNNAEEVAAQNPYVAARDFVEWFEQ